MENLTIAYSTLRQDSPQPCSPSMTGDFRVLATARHTLVCLRVAVLRKSPRPRRFRPAGGGESCRAWHFRVRSAVRLGALRSLPRRDRASPAPSIADSRRMASSRAFSLSLVGPRSLPCLRLGASAANRSRPRRSARSSRLAAPPRSSIIKHAYFMSSPVPIPASRHKTQQVWTAARS